MTQLPWVFEPCDPEDACDPVGQPWPHAVRGRKPAWPMVMGYGHSEIAADTDARRKAQQQDAREVLGERGEAIIASRDILPSVMRMLGTNYAIIDNEIQWIGNPKPPLMLSLGSVWPSSGFDMMPIGT